MTLPYIRWYCLLSLVVMALVVPCTVSSDELQLTTLQLTSLNRSNIRHVASVASTDNTYRQWIYFANSTTVAVLDLVSLRVTTTVISKGSSVVDPQESAGLCNISYNGTKVINASFPFVASGLSARFVAENNVVQLFVAARAPFYRVASVTHAAGPTFASATFANEIVSQDERCTIRVPEGINYTSIENVTLFNGTAFNESDLNNTYYNESVSVTTRIVVLPNQSQAFLNNATDAKHASDVNDVDGMIVDPTDNVLYFTQPTSIFMMRLDVSPLLIQYFGQENATGNRSAEPYGAIDRLNARTAQPMQLSIDTVNRTMYVAEMGMGTIRAIDMTTGNASVILGKFEYYEFPLYRNCTAASPCSASNITLVFPSAVALYRTRAHNGQRWLFVGDLTQAVIYRLVIETGMVDIVAGQMLMSGSVDGGASSSRLRAISRFALAESALIIADGNLRRLELNDYVIPPPPEQPAISKASDAVATSALIIAGASGGVSTTDAVTMVLLSSTMCVESTSSLPTSNVFDSIFFWGSTARNADGTLTHSASQPWFIIALVVGVCLLHLGGVLLFSAEVPETRRRTTTKEPASFWPLMATNRWAEGRFPMIPLIISDTLLPIAVYGGIQAAGGSTRDTSLYAAAVGAVLVAVLLAAGFRYYFMVMVLKHVHVEMIPTVRNLWSSAKLLVTEQHSSPMMQQETKGEEEMQEAQDEEDARSASPGTAASFSASFASLLGIHNRSITQNEQQQQQQQLASPLSSGTKAVAVDEPQTLLLEEITALVVSARAIRESDENSKSGSNKSVVDRILAGGEALLEPHGYWHPNAVASSWGPIFAKSHGRFPNVRHMEFALVFLTAMLTGAAYVFAASKAACPTLLGLVATLYFSAAIAMVYLRPFRLPTDNSISPFSYALLGTIALLRALRVDNAALLGGLQLMQSGVSILRTVVQLYLWIADADNKKLHLLMFEYLASKDTAKVQMDDEMDSFSHAVVNDSLAYTLPRNDSSHVFLDSRQNSDENVGSTTVTLAATARGSTDLAPSSSSRTPRDALESVVDMSTLRESMHRPIPALGRIGSSRGSRESLDAIDDTPSGEATTARTRLLGVTRLSPTTHSKSQTSSSTSTSASRLSDSSQRSFNGLPPKAPATSSRTRMMDDEVEL